MHTEGELVTVWYWMLEADRTSCAAAMHEWPLPSTNCNLNGLLMLFEAAMCKHNILDLFSFADGV